MITSAIAWRGLAVLLAASVAWGGWQWIQLQSARHTILTMERDWAQALVGQMRSARAKEQEWQAHADKVAAEYEQAKIDAERDQAALVDSLRAGNVRFRRLWQGCEASAATGVPETPGPAGQPDGGADDRAESAGRIVRAAAECDAQVRGLQDLIRGVMG